MTFDCPTLHNSKRCLTTTINTINADTLPHTSAEVELTDENLRLDN